MWMKDGHFLNQHRIMPRPHTISNLADRLMNGQGSWPTISLADKVTVITGATAGIGAAAAIEAARAGAHVIGAGRDEHEGEELVSVGNRMSSGSITFRRTDVTDRRQVQSLFKHVARRYGRLDGIVASAGIAGRQPIVTMRPRSDTILATNFFGLQNTIAFGIGAMQRTGTRGALVTISSGHTMVARPGAGMYSVTKHATEALTRQVAAEHAYDGIRANCVRAAGIDTRMLDQARRTYDYRPEKHNLLKRLGKPEEIARLAVILLSDHASFVTGAVWTCDGGLSIAAEVIEEHTDHAHEREIECRLMRRSGTSHERLIHASLQA